MATYHAPSDPTHPHQFLNAPETGDAVGQAAGRRADGIVRQSAHKRDDCGLSCQISFGIN